MMITFYFERKNIMVIDFTRNYLDDDEGNDKYLIVYLVSFFGYMTLMEIIDFFPTRDELLLRKEIKELTLTKQLITIKPFNERTYFTTLHIKNAGLGYKLRVKHIQICKFIRYLLNSKDENGYLINTLERIGTGTAPFIVYIVCNNSIYFLAHMPREKISLYERVIHTDDKIFEEEEKEHARRQSSDTPYTITDERDRIIIVDNEEDIERVKMNHVKFIVCPKGKNFLIKDVS